MDAAELRYLQSLQQQGMTSDMADRQSFMDASGILSANPHPAMGARATNDFRNTQQNLWNSYAARAYQERLRGDQTDYGALAPVAEAGPDMKGVNQWLDNFKMLYGGASVGDVLSNYDPTLGGAQFPDEMELDDLGNEVRKRRGRFMPVSPDAYRMMSGVAELMGVPITGTAMLRQQAMQELARKQAAEQNSMRARAARRAENAARGITMESVEKTIPPLRRPQLDYNLGTYDFGFGL